MGLRERLRSVKQFLKDPQGWSNRYIESMSAEYAKVQKQQESPPERPAKDAREPGGR